MERVHMIKLNIIVPAKRNSISVLLQICWFLGCSCCIATGLPECDKLLTAVRSNDQRIVQHLLASGCDVNCADKHGTTPLHLAVRGTADAIILDLIRAGANVNSIDESGNTPLLIVAFDGRSSVVDILLKAGAKADTRTSGSAIPATPMDRAELGRNADAIRLLLKAGADASAKHPAVFREAILGNSGKLEAMLTREPTLVAERTFPNGLTPLHWVAIGDETECARSLLSHGARIDPHDTAAGESPLHVAAFTGHERVADLLLNYGTDCNQTNFVGQTPLDWAVMRNSEAVVNLLLTNGCSPNISDIRGYTPLHYAAVAGFDKIVDRLLRAGANPEALTSRKQTPLHLAANYGREQAVRTLLKAGVRIDLVDKSGKTALALALEHGHTNVVELLRR